MRTISRSILAVGLALALAAVSHPAAAQAGVARWRGSGNEQMIDQAVRRFGYQPDRLTPAQLRAIDQAWTELLGQTTRRASLNRAQATAIVYLALVDGNDGPRDRPDGYDGRPGGSEGGYGGGRPGGWGAECEQLQADAYRLGALITAPGGRNSLFVAEPERGQARALARQIQEQAVQCRAIAAADRAGEVMTALSDNFPERTDVSRRVDALKRAIQDAAPGRPRR
jgi:hypothetical protein